VHRCERNQLSAVHARIEQHLDRKGLLSHKLTRALAHYSMNSSAQRWKGRSKVAAYYR
jgi:hypothetical protein